MGWLDNLGGIADWYTGKLREAVAKRQGNDQGIPMSQVRELADDPGGMPGGAVGIVTNPMHPDFQMLKNAVPKLANAMERSRVRINFWPDTQSAKPLPSDAAFELRRALSMGHMPEGEVLGHTRFTPDYTNASPGFAEIAIRPSLEGPPRLSTGIHESVHALLAPKSGVVNPQQGEHWLANAHPNIQIQYASDPQHGAVEAITERIMNRSGGATYSDKLRALADIRQRALNNEIETPKVLASELPSWAKVIDAE